MKSAKEHYDEHLGPVYAWMAGRLKAHGFSARSEPGQSGMARVVARK